MQYTVNLFYLLSNNLYFYLNITINSILYILKYYFEVKYIYFLCPLESFKNISCHNIFEPNKLLTVSY